MKEKKIKAHLLLGSLSPNHTAATGRGGLASPTVALLCAEGGLGGEGGSTALLGGREGGRAALWEGGEIFFFCYGKFLSFLL